MTKVVEFHLYCEYCDKESDPVAIGIFSEEFPFSEIDAIQQFEGDWFEVMLEKIRQHLNPKAPERYMRDRLVRHYAAFMAFFLEHSKHRIVLRNGAGDLLIDGQWYKCS
jgi:hypothetical protein